MYLSRIVATAVEILEVGLVSKYGTIAGNGTNAMDPCSLLLWSKFIIEVRIVINTGDQHRRDHLRSRVHLRQLRDHRLLHLLLRIRRLSRQRWQHFSPLGGAAGEQGPNSIEINSSLNVSRYGKFIIRLGYLQHPCYFGFSLKKSGFSHNYF